MSISSFKPVYTEASNLKIWFPSTTDWRTTFSYTFSPSSAEECLKMKNDYFMILFCKRRRLPGIQTWKIAYSGSSETSKYDQRSQVWVTDPWVWRLTRQQNTVTNNFLISCCNDRTTQQKHDNAMVGPFQMNERAFMQCCC